MIPTTAKALHRFVPGSAKDLPEPPVFLLAVPTRRLRAIYDRELVANGVRPYSRDQQMLRIREVIDQIEADNKQEIIGLLDRLEAATPDAPVSDLDLQDWRGLEMRLHALDPQVREMAAANRFYFNMAPQIAARVFLAGWQNRAALFQRGADGLVPEALIDGVDPMQLQEIWVELVGMLNPSEADAKNSASPQPSSPGPANLPEATAPQTDLPGNSSESDTNATQNTTSTEAIAT